MFYSGIKYFSEKKRGELNRQLREKTGLGNDDLTYAPKETSPNMRNGLGPEIHSDPDSDGETHGNFRLGIYWLFQRRC